MTMSQMIGYMGISAFVYFLYHFLREQYLLMYTTTYYETCDKETTTTAPVIKEIKYEDKYLDKFNKFENTFSFQDEDIEGKKQKMNELIELFNAENKDIYECDKDKIDEFKQTAHDFMVHHFLSRLKNSYIIENTPIGNVAMSYNNTKETFEYYSDKNIPYRFLETVARKYVTTFYCKPLYIIMDNELENAKQKYKEEKEKEKGKEKTNHSKKDIFSNFKNIRINQTSHKSSTSNIRQMYNPPPVIRKTANNESQILKENANRYTHLGKFSNFTLLKIVDKKQTSKLSYRDYMMMQNNK